MKVLTKNTREVLSLLSEVNKIGVIQYPITSIKSESGSVVAFFNTKELGEDEFNSFGIFNMNELLQVINLSEEPLVELNDNIIDITSKDSKTRYITTDLGILGDYTKITPVVLEKTKAVDTVLEFELTSDLFTKVKKASDVFKNLEDLIITSKSEDDSIYLEVGDANTRIKNSNSYKLAINGSSTKDVNININVKNLKIIPNGDYIVQVKYNKSKDAYRILMTSKDIDSLEFILAVQN